MTITDKTPLRSRLASRVTELWLLRAALLIALVNNAMSGRPLALVALVVYVGCTVATEQLRRARGADAAVEAAVTEWEGARRVPTSNAAAKAPSRPVMLVLCLIMASAAGLGVIGAYAVTGLVRGDDAPATTTAYDRCARALAIEHARWTRDGSMELEPAVCLPPYLSDAQYATAWRAVGGDVWTATP